MSSVAFLHGRDSDTFGPCTASDTFELCSNTIPVFWLALFDETNLRRMPNADEDDYARWYFTTATRHAVERLTARREHLLGTLPEGADRVHAMFIQFLENSHSPHIQCNPSGVLGFEDASGGWDNTFKQILNALDDAPHRSVLKKRFFRVREQRELSPGWQTYYRYFDLGPRHRIDESERSFAGILAGNGDVGETPWDLEE